MIVYSFVLICALLDQQQILYCIEIISDRYIHVKFQQLERRGEPIGFHWLESKQRQNESQVGNLIWGMIA